ncbi:MAG: TMEM175 family protein [Deltaproteobacteria bacterium]
MCEPPRGVESLTEAPSTGASSSRRSRQAWSPNSRLEALTDGVFAVVMTILVFQLGGSAISSAEAVRDAGFQIDDVEPHKFFSPAAPATMPLRLIKARI